MTDNKNSKISFIEKTGSAMRISQTISALESSSAAHKEIVVPKGDVHIVEQVLNNKNLNGKIDIKSI
jgi:hypothetical protein